MTRRSWLLWLGGLALLGWACGLLPSGLLPRGGGWHTPQPVTALPATPTHAAAAPTPAGSPMGPPRPAATPLAGLHEPPSGIGLLPGLAEWQPWAQQGSIVPGHNQIRWVEASPHGQVADFQRLEGGSDGGGAGLYLPLDLDVTPYPHLYLTVMGRILEEEGGNIANTNPHWFPESGLQVRIRYQTADGETREWYHGFYITPVEGADTEHFSRVPAGEWFTWTSEDLMQWPDPPVRLMRIWVYGFGWGFHSQAAAVDLTASEEATDAQEQQTGTCWLVTQGADTPVYLYPAEDAPRFGTLPPGSRVEVLALAEEGTWVGFDPGVAQACNVGPFRLRWAPITQANGTEGACEAVPVITPPPPDRCYVTPAGPEAPVFAEPRDDARVLAALPAEAYIPVVGQGPDGWLKVLFGPEGAVVPAWMRQGDVCLLGYGPCDALPPAEP